LFCFRHTKNGEDQYRPKQCNVDFEKVKDGTWWRCIVEKNGDYSGVSAHPIRNSAHPDRASAQLMQSAL
jgi:hypothetical protein